MLNSAFSAIGGAKLKSKKTAISIILLLSSALAGCSTTGEKSDFGTSGAALSAPVKAPQKRAAKKAAQPGAQTAALTGGRRYSAIGRASWYGSAFQGKKTANGEIFNMHALTAAHRGLPLPSYARVTNLQNGSSLIVRINDRGPYSGNRIIDLSQQAAQLLDYHRGGLANVKVDYVGPAPAEGHDEAFLRASYRPPAEIAPMGETAIAGAETAPANAPAETAELKEKPPLSFKAEGADEQKQAQPAQAALAAAAAGGADNAGNLPQTEAETAAAPVPVARPANAPQQAADNASAEAAPSDQRQQLDLALSMIKSGKAQLQSSNNFKPLAETAAVQ